MREVVLGALVAFATKLVAAGLTFGLNVVVARLLGSDGSGAFFLALTVMTVGTVFGRIGLDNAMLRFMAAAEGAENRAEFKGVYQNGMALALLSSTAAALGIFLLAPLLSCHLFNKPELLVPLRTMAFAVIPVTLLTLHSESLKALKRILTSQMIYGVAVPGLSLAILLLLEPAGNVEGATRAYTLAAALTALAAFICWKLTTRHLSNVHGTFPLRTLLSSSLPLFWVASMTLVMTWTGTILLAVWRTSSDVGIFTAAARTSLLTSIILFSVDSIAAPKFAALYRKGDMDALSSIARRSTTLMAIFAAPVILVFVAAPRTVMGLFGAEFREGGTLLRIMALGQLVNVATGPVAYLLIMSGHERLARNNMMVAAGVNIALNCSLIPLAGRMGAAIATAISIATLNIGAAYLVWSRLGILTIPLEILLGNRNHKNISSDGSR